MARYFSDEEKTVRPASERLLRDLARCDNGDGVRVQYLSRGRYQWDGSRAVYNRSSFWPLYAADLVDDGGNDAAPVKVTKAGRRYVAELEQREAQKTRPRTKPNAESPSALRALAALARFDGPVLPHSGFPRGIWRLGSRDGFGARETTFHALVDAGYARIIPGDFMARRIVITEAGRERLARRRT
jgi:hypothetical protein